MKRLAYLGIVLLLFAGCGKANDTASADNSTEISVSKETVSDTSVSEQEPESISSPATFNFEVINNEENASYHGVLTAYGNSDEVLWTYETEEVYVGQLDNLEDFGASGNGYYLNVDGTIVKIAIEGTAAGQVEWTTADYGGASSSFVFAKDESGKTILYLSGYFGPEFMAVDEDGKVLAWTSALELREADNRQAFFWGSSLTPNGGNLDLFFDSNEATVTFNPKTMEVIDVVYPNTEIMKGVYEYRVSPMLTGVSMLETEEVVEWRIETVGDINQEIIAEIDSNSMFFPKEPGELISEVDYNKDGLTDLLIYIGTVGTHGVQLNSLYINTGASFVEIPDFAESGDPVYDESTGLISSTVRDSAASYYNRIYRIDGMELVLVEEHYFIYDDATKDFVEQK